MIDIGKDFFYFLQKVENVWFMRNWIQSLQKVKPIFLLIFIIFRLISIKIPKTVRSQLMLVSQMYFLYKNVKPG